MALESAHVAELLELMLPPLVRQNTSNEGYSDSEDVVTPGCSLKHQSNLDHVWTTNERTKPQLSLIKYNGGSTCSTSSSTPSADILAVARNDSKAPSKQSTFILQENNCTDESIN